MTLEIACTVSSMLTTTPRDRPRASWAPTPRTFKRPSAATSATTATIFDVPMSRPTISSLLSLLMTCPYGQTEWKQLPALRDNAQRHQPDNGDQRPTVLSCGCRPVAYTVLRMSRSAHRRCSECVRAPSPDGSRCRGADSTTDADSASADGCCGRPAPAVRCSDGSGPSARYRYRAGHAAPAGSGPDCRGCYPALRKHHHHDSATPRSCGYLHCPSAPPVPAHRYPAQDCPNPDAAHRHEKPRVAARPPGGWP